MTAEVAFAVTCPILGIAKHHDPDQHNGSYRDILISGKRVLNQFVAPALAVTIDPGRGSIKKSGLLFRNWHLAQPCIGP
ncbi:MAG: hypothetical protein ACJ71W_14630 [Terriglobales bacterium]